MMYGSMTLTTAPLTLTMCAMESPTGIPGGSANSVTISRLTDASPLPDETGTGTGSASGSISSALTLSVSVSGSTVTTAISNSAVDSSDGSLVSSRQPTVSPSGNGIISNDQSVTSLSASDGSQLVSGAASSASIGGSGAPIATVATSNPPEVSSLVELSPGGNTPTPTGLGSLPTFLASTQASASAGLYRPTGSLLGVGASQQNGTISLPPLSIDALKLALFLKNLGVWTFNESRIAELSSLTARQEREGLASLVADIAVLKTLRMLLLQSGNIDVPSCQYDLPKNITELSFLMVTLKSINLGVFMSMAEAAERPVAILLSSIASVEAKHIALLSDHTHHNASAQSFDTPATPAWAYNIALQYSQPGSCSVQLPLPILPKLTINNHTFAHVQPGAKVSVEWGAAAGLSGTAFAVLTAQEGLTSIADLTAATLAGPLVVNSQP
ncbi:hypothetical protein COCC4DRAFT_200607 [Bipolaris maydis ATCC 48331]|uniref:Uncharacterized protein n=1 Tax=Cochliobolus heterostrophus (strain C4 / ATCC 48331 / race T) TaxID=665024 RepID=N4WUM5_COCH4|nr:uncharacterized protein COCC4DRAFT_200607 [Bipolaris maydis ATCC 48331]ENI03155.1 hypothetical protein COCC4DRAFT_200607 [Bipolaris maydis ATCC 48331]